MNLLAPAWYYPLIRDGKNDTKQRAPAFASSPVGGMF